MNGSSFSVDACVPLHFELLLSRHYRTMEMKMGKNGRRAQGNMTRMLGTSESSDLYGMILLAYGKLSCIVVVSGLEAFSLRKFSCHFMCLMFPPETGLVSHFDFVYKTRFIWYSYTRLMSINTTLTPIHVVLELIFAEVTQIASKQAHLWRHWLYTCECTCIAIPLIPPESFPLAILKCVCVWRTIRLVSLLCILKYMYNFAFIWLRNAAVVAVSNAIFKF